MVGTNRIPPFHSSSSLLITDGSRVLRSLVENEDSPFAFEIASRKQQAKDLSKSSTFEENFTKIEKEFRNLIKYLFLTK